MAGKIQAGPFLCNECPFLGTDEKKHGLGLIAALEQLTVTTHETAETHAKAEVEVRRHANLGHFICCTASQARPG